MSLDEIQFDEGNRLGNGAFGVVYKGRFRGRPAAFKTLDVKHAGGNLKLDEAQVVDAFLWEALNLALTSHPGVVKLLGVCIDKTVLCMVLEFCGGGSLDGAIRPDPPLPASDVWRWSCQLAGALQYLHDNGQASRRSTLHLSAQVARLPCRSTATSSRRTCCWTATATPSGPTW